MERNVRDKVCKKIFKEIDRTKENIQKETIEQNKTEWIEKN